MSENGQREISGAHDKPENKKGTVTLNLLRVLQGIVIGAGAILPGISGGVLCVTFGIYQPMMEMLESPIRGIKKYFKMFLPVGIGWALGFVLFAKVIDVFFSTNSTLAVCAMIGLIAGTTPSLIEEGGKQGRSKSAWGCFVVSILVLFALFSVLNSSKTLNIQPNTWWYFACGAFWGLSLVIPGMTSSSILIFLGLYQPMAEAIAKLDFGVIVPVISGIILTVLLLARFVNYLFRKHYALIFHVIMGFVFASTLVIVPTSFQSGLEAVLSILMFAVGYVLAWGTEKISLKYQ